MKKLWFRAKRYGYGWYPMTWQGWLVIGVYVLIALADARLLEMSPKSTTTLAWFIGIIVVATILLLIISWRTGEKARWRWGDKK